MEKQSSKQMEAKREELIELHECTDCLEEKEKIGHQIEQLTKWIEEEKCNS